LHEDNAATVALGPSRGSGRAAHPRVVATATEVDDIGGNGEREGENSLREGGEDAKAASIRGPGHMRRVTLPRIALAAAPKCLGKKATIVGTARADVLKGTARADVIVGLRGGDTIKGVGGNDRICGGKGNDKLIGGAGGDGLVGEAGNDVLSGGAGNDFFLGGAGNDSSTVGPASRTWSPSSSPRLASRPISRPAPRRAARVRTR
jgi:Ca2+-binding RTX toxin-like protein